jgi:DivIVA domain-containing protein
VATDDEAFSTAMRGYNREEVDNAIQDLRRELIKANSDKAESAKELKRLGAMVADLQAELDETGSPTYSGLGTKLENVLRVAEEQSTRLISQADIDAEKLRNSVQGEVNALRVEAMESADRIVAEATAKAAELLDAARSEADDLLAESRAKAAAAEQDALREAASIRGAVATEAAEARATA